jgi:hypothetical protein
MIGPLVICLRSRTRAPIVKTGRTPVDAGIGPPARLLDDPHVASSRISGFDSGQYEKVRVASAGGARHGTK